MNGSAPRGIWAELVSIVWAAARNKNDPARRSMAIELILTVGVSLLLVIVPTVLDLLDVL